MRKFLSARSATAVAVSALLVAALVACSAPSAETGSANASDGPKEGGEIRIAWAAQPPTLDPVATTAYATRDIARNIFEGLIALDANDVPQPVLARSFSVSSDNTTFSFVMRDDVSFHDGSDMTLDDVVSSIERWVADSVVGQRFFAESTVTNDGGDTVVIEAASPLAAGLVLIADNSQQLAIMPKAVVEARTETGVSDIIGTGPFKFSSWEADQAIVLERFTDYASPGGEASGLAGEKKAYADKLIFDIVPDASTRLSGLQTGMYDMSQNMSTDHLNAVQADSSLVTIFEEGYFGGLVFNKKEGPSSDVYLRLAIQAALEMEAVGQAGFGSKEFFTLSGALSAPGAAAYTDGGLEAYNAADPKKVEDLLAKSSYNGETLRILSTRDLAGNYQEATEIQNQLKKLGINSDLMVSDGATFYSRRTDPAGFDMFVTGWSLASTPILYTVLQPSYPGWTDNAAITKAISAVNAATSDGELGQAYTDLQTSVYDYVPLIKLVDYSQLNGAGSDIGGYRQHMGPILYGLYSTK
jgi:peptide/nickel transport system substrate-binding protein